MASNDSQTPKWFFEWNRGYADMFTRFSLESRIGKWHARIRTDSGGKHAVFIGSVQYGDNTPSWFKNKLTLREAINFWDNIMSEVARRTYFEFPDLSGSPYINEYRKITEQIFVAENELKSNPPSAFEYEKKVAELLAGLENFGERGLRQLD